MPDPASVSPEELRQVDARYAPFPAFEQWVDASFDEQSWAEHLHRFEELKAGAREDDLRKAIDVVLRAAALDTGAIEGLYDVDRGITFTVATQAAAWQQALEQHGADTRRYFDAQLSAYELILDAATDHTPITEAFIRRLHEEICAGQDTYRVLTDQGWQDQPLPKGVYKDQPNHVLRADGEWHAYAPVGEVRVEMARLVETLQSDEFNSAHPVHQASYVHYAFVVVHPFGDGNGRVARALASIYLYRAASIPLVVFADQALAYFETLTRADEGDRRPFVQFVVRRAVETLALLFEIFRSASTKPIDEAIGGLRSVLTTHGGLTYSEVDVLARRLLAVAHDQVKVIIEDIDLPEGVHIGISNGSGSRPSSDPRYRSVVNGSTNCVEVTAQSPAPAEAAARLSIWPLIAADPGAEPAFRLEVPETREHQDVYLDEVYPMVTAALEMRIRYWLQRLMSDMLDQLLAEAEQSLRNSEHR